MSNQERRNPPQKVEEEAFSRLEQAVGAALDRIEALQRDLEEARRQVGSAEDLLRKFSEGEESPSQLTARLEGLERENEELSERLRKGKEGVDRLLARVRFLEEQG